MYNKYGNKKHTPKRWSRVRNLKQANSKFIFIKPKLYVSIYLPGAMKMEPGFCYIEEAELTTEVRYKYHQVHPISINVYPKYL